MAAPINHYPSFIIKSELFYSDILTIRLEYNRSDVAI